MAVRILMQTMIKRTSTKRQSMLSPYQGIEEAEAEAEAEVQTEAEEVISLHIEMMMARERQTISKLNNLIKMEETEDRRLSTKTLVAEEAAVGVVAEEAMEDLRDTDRKMKTILSSSRSENKSKWTSRLGLVQEETSLQVALTLIRNSEKVLQVLREVKCKTKPFVDLQGMHWEMSMLKITTQRRRKYYSLPKTEATSQIKKTKPLSNTTIRTSWANLTT